MDSLFWLLSLPLGLSVLVALGRPVVRRFPIPVGLFLALSFWLGAVLLLIWIPTGTTKAFSAPWVPELVNFSLRLDAFNAWFGVLILGIGGCIMLYAATYFANEKRLPFLLSTLLVFSTAMLGVIWADDLFLLFLFWEGTSISSFLLVGFSHHQEEARAKASQALIVTLLGGAGMLAGFLLLSQSLGTSSLTALLSLTDPLPSSPTLTAAILLIILGALTKSAQFPFHFWLPNAMAGPTPVSAFLHSATMVKAGVFLLATLAPALSQHPVWTPILASSGFLTVLIAVLRAAREQDLKQILASTTLAALGFLTLLAGLGTQAALLGFVIFLTSHALYKAPLFLSAGNLEKRFGTRNLNQLHGALRGRPSLTSLAVLVSTFSLLGFAPLPGFLGKEYLLKATWAYSPVLAILVGLAAAGTLALGLRILIPLLSKTDPASPKKAVPLPMGLSALLPALGALALTISLPAANHQFLGPAAEALGAALEASYKLWHGWTPALIIGLSALALSFGIAKVMRLRSDQPLPSLFAPRLDQGYDQGIKSLLIGSKKIANYLTSGSLVWHLAIMLLGIGLLTAFSLNVFSIPALELTLTEHSYGLLVLVPVLILSLRAAAVARETTAILVSLGFVGLLVAIFFLWFSAPDLALTQLLAETLLLFLVAVVLHKRNDPDKVRNPVAPRLIMAVGGGAVVSFLILKAMLVEWDPPVSTFHLTKSLPEAYGANAVNVILVDFRALDTFGEILVLGIAALAATSALGAARPRHRLPGTNSTPWLKGGGTVICWLLIPVAGWIFWRGHNAPGGGFISALVAALAFGLALLNGLSISHPSLLRRLSFRLISGGLLVAFLSALSPLLVSQPFFKGLWYHRGDLHLGTPLIFDLGVFLTVLGFTLAFLRHFHPRPLPS